jgi:hypothetical protein
MPIEIGAGLAPPVEILARADGTPGTGPDPASKYEVDAINSTLNVVRHGVPFRVRLGCGRCDKSAKVCRTLQSANTLNR